MLTTANRSRTVLSVLEAPIGQPIVHFQDLWLTGRLLAPQSEEAELVLVQIDVTANQAVGPDLAKRPGLSQQRHLAQAVAAPQVDQTALRSLLQVQLPARRERPAIRRGLDPRRPLFSKAATYLWECPCKSSRLAC